MQPEEIPEWIPFLRRSLVFRELVPEDLARLALRLQKLSLPKGATLYSRGEPGDAFYLIASGQCRLINERAGREIVSAFLGRGDSLGEMSLLTGEPRSTTAKLDTTAEFLVLSKKDFEEVVRETPSILAQLSRLIAQRLLTQQDAAAPSDRQELVMVLNTLEPPARTLFTMQLALALIEQTRSRVLLLDLSPDTGAAARALGLRPALTSEAMLREQDLREPAVLRNLVAEHPSGLEVMSLPASVLGGRLYRGIFLLMNLLRESHDYVLVASGRELGDVEKSILEEADQWVLVGSTQTSGVFRALELELERVAPEPRKPVKVWLGAPDAASALQLHHDGVVKIPWTDELSGQLQKGISPYQLMDRFPKTRRGFERAARKLGKLSIGIAMGTGAALGYSLIGIMKGLKAAGIDADVIAGTSIGSVIGGFHALGLEPEEVEGLANQVDKAWVYENLFWDLTIPRSGLFAGTTLLRFLRSYYGDREFHELDVPFACVATDIETGEEVVMRDGKVGEAIRASCGIPLLFAPLHREGRFLVDGGLVDPVPTKVASQLGADILISINLTMPAGQRKSAVRDRHEAALARIADLAKLKELTLPEALKAPNMLEILFQMIYTMEYEIAQSRMELAHVSIHPDLSGFHWTEMHRAADLIDMGERVAETAVPKIKAILPFFADHCKLPMRKQTWKSY
ncbi:MAG: cyclic nucleotide-binding domain-containing protein [Elusimicrobia bacterium]|nr:cyclic nucleotide-binding domain-containing protein [Elusimicrobiota bacterium]